MAVTFDAVGPSSAGAAIPANNALSWNHTTGGGSNRLLIVVVANGVGNDAGSSFAVTYNGVTMTSVSKVHSNNDIAGFVEMFKLVNPPTGTFSVAVTLTGTASDIEGGSVSFDGVDQATPVQNIATAFGDSTTPSVNVTSTSGNMVIDGAACGRAFSSSGQTNRWTNNQNTSTAAGNASSSTASGAGSVTMSYVVTSDFWAIIGVDIKADGGGGGGGVATRGNIGVIGQSVVRKSTW